jgi:LysM repeat protein
MKFIITSILVFIQIIFYAQNTYTITVDGKDVLVNTKTGRIVANASPEILNTNNAFLYQVVKGDTYYSIANKHHLPLAVLYELNAFKKSDVLLIGTTLFVNSKTKSKKFVSKKNENSATFYHIVSKGDTLYSLSKKYNTTVDQLLVINGMNSNNISINQRLRIK